MKEWSEFVPDVIFFDKLTHLLDRENDVNII